MIFPTKITLNTQLSSFLRLWTSFKKFRKNLATHKYLMAFFFVYSSVSCCSRTLTNEKSSNSFSKFRRYHFAFGWLKAIYNIIVLVEMCFYDFREFHSFLGIREWAFAKLTCTHVYIVGI
ncbi:hypothetical protein ROZALSC1DRAFT_25563 [Rozella allomycis CSF55]|uniref:Uncharacterized protein n=1 Tax=Rozella allomycis (strain CSF55) TaxID=988480 RepID=A0A4P9YAD0_ROZAC|nr:hypothetical protein ROZALSC1DRAFT_25563 [Rozella allomycis CSF55]